MTDETKPGEYKPPASEEEEKSRFEKMLANFMKDDDPPKPPAAPAPSSSSSAAPAQDIAGIVNSVLDQREKEQGRDKRLTDMDERLKKVESGGRKKRWFFSPLFD